MQNPLIRFNQDLNDAFTKETKPQKAVAASIAYLRYSSKVAIASQVKYLAPVQVYNGIRRVRQIVA